jgi:hypothetical protein
MQQNFIELCFLTIAGAAICAAGFNEPPPAAVPEPGSIVLLGSAAIGIGYATWRRSRKK